MRCDDVIVNLPDLLLERIDPNLKKSIENHLEYCAKCRRERDELLQPIELLDQAGIEEYPDSFWQELRASIMEKVSEPRKAPWRVPAFASALAVLLVAIGVVVYRFSVQPVPKVQTVAALATSLPADQAVALPQLNINYVDAVSPQASELDEINAVDDSVQQEVVNSLWASIGDSATLLENYDYTGNPFSN